MEETFDFRKAIYVIDLRKNYTEVQLMDFNENEEGALILRTSSPFSMIQEEYTIADIELDNLFPYPIQYDKYYIPTKYERISKFYYDYSNKIKRFIYDLSEIQISESQLISNIEASFKLKAYEIRIIIKILISAGVVGVKKYENQYQFYITEQHVDFFRKRSFLARIVDEIVTKSKRIEYLISHSPTVGHYRENLFINTLSKYLPKKFSISSGFIDGCTRQIDVIIYDSHNFIPLFNEDNIVVVQPEAVRAVIEIKSNLTSVNLYESLSLLSEIDKYYSPIIPIFKGIFAFNTIYKKVDSIGNRIIQFYNNNLPENKLEHLYQSINSVCILNRYFVYSRHVKKATDDELIVLPELGYLKNLTKLKSQGAIFLFRLFQFLDANKYAKEINNNYFIEILKDYEAKSIGYIHTEDLFPSGLEIVGNIAIYKPEDIWSRIDNVQKWIHGKISTQEMYEIYKYGNQG